MRNHRRLLAYARPHWRAVVALLLTTGVAVAVDLLRPWPMKLLVDNVLGGQTAPGPLPAGEDALLALVVGGTVFIFLAATGVSMVKEWFSTGLNQRMTYDVGADLFGHLQRQSLLFHSRRPVGDTISRVTGDSYAASTLLTGALLPVLQSIVTLIAMFTIMWALEWRLTLLSLAVVPFLLLTIRVFGRPMKDRSRTRRDYEGRMMDVVQQTLTMVPAVQAFTREEHELGRYRHLADKTTGAYLRATFTDMWFKLFAGLATTIGTAAIIYAGAQLALDGTVTVGTILVFLAYLTSLYGPLNSISYTAATVQEAAAQGDRVFEILDTVPDVEDGPDARDVAIRGHVRYEEVSFGYAPDRAAVDGVSLEARPGEILAIVGRTGAGKTTLVNLLMRFFDPWSGRVTIDGTDVRDIRLRSLRGQVAMVLQEPFIFPMTLRDNIAYGRPGATEDEIRAAATAANAAEFIERLPDGYDTMVGERGATLSGGEKQRLSIARAFLKDAPILVLDEPTSALDAKTEAALLDALGRLMKGRVAFVIAHRLSTIRGADQILVVDRGRITERGTHAELLAARGPYAAMYEQQMDIAVHETVNGNGHHDGNGNGNGHAPEGVVATLRRRWMEVRR